LVEVSARTRHARELFAPLGPTYDRYARALSFGQDPRWRRFLVSRVPADAQHVLDVATGTGAVAIELARVSPARSVVGVDQSAGDARRGPYARRERPGSSADRASGGPRGDACRSQTASSTRSRFTYLLRYVDDPRATLGELARVVRPGGVVACSSSECREACGALLWELYVRVGLPAAGALVSPAWRDVGRFLGPSIRDFWHRHPAGTLPELWRAAGIGDVPRAAAQPRRRRRRLGDPVVSSESRPAFYALAPGRLGATTSRCSIPPYTLWHLSYVAVGAALAPQIKWGILGWTVLAFLLALGLGGHALDELAGHPLGTRIPRRLLAALAVVSIAAACAIGLVVAARTTWWLVAFICVGAFLVVATTSSSSAGGLPFRLWFAASWGAFPVADGVLRLGGAAARGGGRGCSVRRVATSLAQRTLSTQVRTARRRGGDVQAARPAEVALKAPVRGDAAARRSAPSEPVRLTAYHLAMQLTRRHGHRLCGGRSRSPSSHSPARRRLPPDARSSSLASVELVAALAGWAVFALHQLPRAGARRRGRRDSRRARSSPRRRSSSRPRPSPDRQTSDAHLEAAQSELRALVDREAKDRAAELERALARARGPTPSRSSSPRSARSRKTGDVSSHSASADYASKLTEALTATQRSGRAAALQAGHRISTARAGGRRGDGSPSSGTGRSS
jgi:demethylmenaquinone methyltransferase/2-methoxy-6-polyprenyl-1,4-benzoquinol methylase